MGRGRRGRRLAILILCGSVVLVSLVAVLVLFPASTMGPAPDPLGQPSTWAGAIGAVVGLAWMVRIVRAAREPERGAGRWRATRAR